MSTANLNQTTPIFNCPQCRTPVGVGDTSCRSCGMNLALAAALAERLSVAQVPASPPAPTADLPRFGEFLVREGFITAAQLTNGLSRQREAAAVGVQRTIGQTLVHMGYLTAQALDQASVQQVKQLQMALEDSNRQLEQRVQERTRALQAALQRLTDLEEVKANFVANISHELRTPLVPIRGYVDLLAGGSLGPLTAQQVEAVKTIARSAQRLEELINELIQFASSVKGEMTIVESPLALADLAQPLWDYFEPRAAANKLRLCRDFRDDTPAARGDPEKIYWVLFQLLDNAVKFTPPGGEIVLAGQVSHGRLRISIRDTGIGIGPERLGIIFEPFRQAVVEQGQLVDGTGLGLALVKRILEAHEAQVQVESQLGQGSCFTFELPLAASAEAG
jgi:signal transduction histidine kinase